jgi:hypothetical protein
MYKRVLTLCVFSGLFITLFSKHLSAQQLRLSVDGGISKLTGDEFERWNLGYNVGADMLVHLTDNLALGGRLAYGRWSPNDDEFPDLTNTSGSFSLIEVTPIARVMTSFPLSPLNIFAQAGGGLYISDKRVSGISVATNSDIDLIPSDPRYNFGTSAAAGVLFGSPKYISIELYPAFHTVFDDNNTINYFSINLGLGLGI